jgi:hypothetical protein
MRSAATWMTWCYMEGSMWKVYFDEHIHSFGWGLVYCSWSYSPRTKWLFSLDETARDLVLCPHTLVWGRWRMENMRLLIGWTGRGGGTHMPFNMHAWIYLSRHVAHVSFLSHSAGIMKECRELLLVDSRNLHCAMVIPLVQLNVRVEETNMGFGVHHQFVGNYVVMRYWWWVLTGITSCCSFCLLLVLAVRWVNSWAHTTPRKKQPGTRIMHEFLLLFTYSCLNQVFFFLSYDPCSHQTPSLVAETLASGPLLILCCDHCSLHESCKHAC